MNTDNFIIKINDLKILKNELNFKINKEFFNTFNYNDIDECDIIVKMSSIFELNKFNLTFKIKGNIKTPCDSCGEDLVLKLEFTDKRLIVISDEKQSNEIIFLPFHENVIDISHMIYEMIVLFIPIKRSHILDGKDCNKEILNQINKKNKLIDDRWSSLKKVNIKI